MKKIIEYITETKNYRALFGVNKKHEEKTYEVYKTHTWECYYVRVHSDKDVHDLCDRKFDKKIIDYVIDTFNEDEDLYKNGAFIRPVVRPINANNFKDSIEEYGCVEPEDLETDFEVPAKAEITAKQFTVKYWKENNWLL